MKNILFALSLALVPAAFSNTVSPLDVLETMQELVGRRNASFSAHGQSSTGLKCALFFGSSSYDVRATASGGIQTPDSVTEVFDSGFAINDYDPVSAASHEILSFKAEKLSTLDAIVFEIEVLESYPHTNYTLLHSARFLLKTDAKDRESLVGEMKTELVSGQLSSPLDKKKVGDCSTFRL